MWVLFQNELLTS